VYCLAVGLTVLLFALALMDPSGSRAQAKSPYNKERLLSAIRTNAKTGELSTQQLVEYIRQRGVDFELTTPDEARFRNAGASEEVIGAIKQNHRSANSGSDPGSHVPRGFGMLTINSTPKGCKVFINGQFRGTTGEEGLLRLPPLKNGPYKISLQKENYDEQERSITVNSGTSDMQSFALTPRKGTLTVTPSIPGARVSLGGIDYPEGVNNLSVAPNSYEVRVSRPGYKTFTQVVTISPGQPFSLEVTLEPIKVEEMIAQGMDSLRQRNYAQAIAISREVLSAKPDEPKATLLLGISYFYSGNYDACVGNLAKAISLGEQVILPVQRHNKFGMLGENDSLTPGMLTIGKDLLEFRTAIGGTPVFSVHFDKVYRVLLENNRGGRVQMKIGDPGKKKDNGKDFNFHPIQAGIQQVVLGSSVRTAVSCDNCLPAAQAIYQILLQVKSSFETAAPTKP
jgi:tetratricopeptide (TPR) repeat protein